MEEVPEGPTIAGGFVEETVFYFLLKVATSMDDLIWLSPFLAIAETAPAKINTFLIYFGICLLVSFEALGLAWVAVNGLTMLLHHDAGGASRVLKFLGALCIGVFAFMEWKSDQDDDEEVDPDEDDDPDEEMSDKLGHDAEVDYDSNKGNPAVETTSLLEQGVSSRTEDATLGTQAPSSDDGSDQNTTPARHGITASARQRIHVRHVLIDLFVVGVCGTVDTLAVFFSVLVGRSPIRPVPLLIGSALAAVLIMAFAYSITLCLPFTRCLQRVPLWALLCAISLYILVSGLVK